MTNAYTEDQLAEQPAIGLLAEDALIESGRDHTGNPFIFNSFLFD